MYPARLVPLFAFAVFAAQAAWLDESEIKTAAAAFPVRNAIGSAVLPGRTLLDVTARGSLWVARYSPSGHAIFSGSDLVGPVITFAATDFAEPDEKSAFYAVLAGASEGCQRVESEEETPEGVSRRAKWAKLLSSGTRLLAGSATGSSLMVEPFLKTQWSQWQPYNDYSPVYSNITDSAYRGRVPCGCVATALAQVFNYWRWPVRVDKAQSYLHPFEEAAGTTGLYAIRFDGHVPFDWGAFDNVYEWFDYDLRTYDLRASVPESMRYPVARLISFCSSLAQMEFAGAGSSASIATAIANSPWYSGGTRYDAETDHATTLAMARADIAAGRPVLIEIPGHAVIGHGWMEDGSTSYVYLNYGWGGNSGDGYYNFDDKTSPSHITDIYGGFKPRFAVQLDPLPVVSSSSVKLDWHIPDCWTNALNGFKVIACTTDTTELKQMLDDFSTVQGSSTSERITVDTNAGTLMIPPLAYGTYTWNDLSLLTSRSVLTYRIKSSYALGLAVTVEASFNGGDWTVVSSPSLNLESYSTEWKTVRVFLGGHGGETVRFRIRSIEDDDYYYENGVVSLDDFKVTEIFGQISQTREVPATARSLMIDGLESGELYSFAVLPMGQGAEESDPVTTTVEGTALMPRPGNETYEFKDIVYSASADDPAWSVSGTTLSDTSFVTDPWQGGFTVSINGHLTTLSTLSFDWTVKGYYVKTTDSSRSYDSRDVLTVTFTSSDGTVSTLMSEVNRMDRPDRQSCTISLVGLAGQSGEIAVTFEHKDLQIAQQGVYGMKFYEPKVTSVTEPVLPPLAVSLLPRSVCPAPGILSVVSGTSSFPDGLFGECAIGMNMLTVTCSEGTVSLAAYPSATTLIPASAVTVRPVGGGVFNVAIDASGLPEYAERSRMILTLAATDANGTVAYRDMSLRFSRTATPISSVKVRFNACGGMVSSGEKNYVVGEPYHELPEPVREHYNFAGWWTAASGGTLVTVSSTVPNAAQELFAHWDPCICTLIFQANHDDGGIVRQTFAYGQSVTLAANVFERSGYMFAGWASSPSGAIVYADGDTFADMRLLHDEKMNLYAVWRIKPAAVLACEDIFSGMGSVSAGDSGVVLVTLTNEVCRTIELPDDIGEVTIDLNGYSITGTQGCAAIRIVAGSGAGEATRLEIADTSGGVKGQVAAGAGMGAGIEIDEAAASAVRIDVADGISVFNGDGTEQSWDDLMQVKETLVEGVYFKKTLAELGYDVPVDGTSYAVVAKGLPAGLKLRYNAAVKDKKGRVTVKEKSTWWIEGVPTASLDFFTNPPYLVITANGVTRMLVLPIEVIGQEVTGLGELALGQAVNERFFLPGVTDGWTVSGLPTGLKYTAKIVTKKVKSGGKTTTVTVAEPYSVYGTTTKAGLFAITAKKKVSGYYETKKFRILVTPATFDTALFGEDLTNITTMAYVPFEWNLANDVSSIGGKVTKVTGLPAGLAFAAANTYYDKKKTNLKQAGQTIVGKPTKPGTYAVTFTKNVKSGKKTVAKTAQILWKVVANDAELSLDFNTDGGVMESGTVGLLYDGILAFTATEGAKVTASGLPKGLRLVDLGGGRWGFSGFTTTSGAYLVTVTATLNGKTIVQRLALNVTGLPTWAKGTFNGNVECRTGNGGLKADAAGSLSSTIIGLATITVSSGGKISGKFQELGTNWTISAESYTGYDAVASNYSATVAAKYAYKVKSGKKTVTKYLTRESTLTVGTRHINDNASNQEAGTRGFAVLAEKDDGPVVEACQNLWSSTYKATGKKLFSSKSGKKTLAYKMFIFDGATDEGRAVGLTAAESLLFKVTTAGAVTATLTFDTGKRKKGKPVYYKPTCSTVVIPMSDPDADTFVCEVSFYFAPNAANGFEGYAACVRFW